MKDTILIVSALLLLAAVGIGAEYLPATQDNAEIFSGTVRTGAEIPEKNFCGEGLYLVADPGTYLDNQTTMLLLRDEDEEMLTNPAFVGGAVAVRGIHPTDRVFCEALICECEEYIIVKDIFAAPIVNTPTLQ